MIQSIPAYNKIYLETKSTLMQNVPGYKLDLNTKYTYIQSRP